MINIRREQVNSQNINSALFLRYIEEYGFYPNNYCYILELIQSAGNSMSQFLREYRHFLLSRKVEYVELDKMFIDGAYGYINECGIIVPKTLANDERFLYSQPKTIHLRHSYNVPTIEDFNVIIANGISTSLKNLVNFPHDKYIGFCMDSNDENLENAFRYYQNLLDLMNHISWRGYVLEHEVDSTAGKQFCLLKKSGLTNKSIKF